MKQSNVIFGTLLFAFVVYITLRGQLPAYLDLFRSKQSSASSNSGNSSAGRNMKETVKAFLNAAPVAWA